MAGYTSPNDPKKFTLIAFIAFVVVFVVVMLMMLWHGDVTYGKQGERLYETRVVEP